MHMTALDTHLVSMRHRSTMLSIPRGRHIPRVKGMPLSSLRLQVLNWNRHKTWRNSLITLLPLWRPPTRSERRCQIAWTSNGWRKHAPVPDLSPPALDTRHMSIGPRKPPFSSSVRICWTLYLLPCQSTRAQDYSPQSPSPSNRPPPESESVATTSQTKKENTEPWCSLSLLMMVHARQLLARQNSQEDGEFFSPPPPKPLLWPCVHTRHQHIRGLSTNVHSRTTSPTRPFPSG